MVRKMNAEAGMFGQYDLYIDGEDVWTFSPDDGADEVADAVVSGLRLPEADAQRAARIVNDAMGGIEPAELSEAVHTAAVAWRMAELGA